MYWSEQVTHVPVLLQETSAQRARRLCRSSKQFNFKALVLAYVFYWVECWRNVLKGDKRLCLGASPRHHA
jgi:hypothetical protein